jgi:hypothetical protein
MTPAAILQEYKQSLAALTKQHALMLEHLKQQYHFLRSLPSNQPSARTFGFGSGALHYLLFVEKVLIKGLI